MEIKKTCSFLFLDTLVTRLTNGELHVSVCRKPTHTDIPQLFFTSLRACKEGDGTMFVQQSRKANETLKEFTLGTETPDAGTKRKWLSRRCNS